MRPVIPSQRIKTSSNYFLMPVSPILSHGDVSREDIQSITISACNIYAVFMNLCVVLVLISVH